VRRVCESVAVAIALSSLALSCAKMGSPPGGPEDTSGPGTVSTFPQADAVRVPRKMEARIQFDEAVNRRSVETSVFLSPDPGDRLRLLWRGNLLRICYLDSLVPDRTYEVVIGSDAKDIRGNPMGRPFSLAFSTGDHIDQGRIWGQVAGEEKPQSIYLWAYALGDSAPPNPQTDSPAYRTQPDGSGTFHFSHLRDGNYRVFAVADVGMDGFWNPSKDRIGVPPYDVKVTDVSTPYLSFRLALLDTSAPQVRGILNKNERQLEVRFSKPISATPLFHLESLAGDTVSIFTTYQDPLDSTSWQLFTQQPLTKGKWKLETVLDERPAFAQLSFVDTVTVHVTTDTTRPTIVKQIPSPRTRLTDPPVTFELYFSEAISVNDSTAWFSMKSEMPADSFPLHPSWYNSAHLSLTPPQSLSRGKTYTVAYNAASLSDLAGNRLGDTVSTFTVQVLSEDSLGSLSGVLNDSQGGSHVISAEALQTHEVVRELTNVPAGEFVLENLPAGPYLIDVLRDTDKSGAFSPGSVIPWRYSECFWSAPDTFAVRARWDRGGITLNFPSSQ
jgi:methionine-rich copper-binding protein CopC